MNEKLVPRSGQTCLVIVKYDLFIHTSLMEASELYIKTNLLLISDYQLNICARYLIDSPEVYNSTEIGIIKLAIKEYQNDNYYFYPDIIVNLLLSKNEIKIKLALNLI